MRILVLSDSHSGLSAMRDFLDILKPDAVVHLGDYVRDGMQMAQEYPQLRFYQVAGNCDMYRSDRDCPEVMIPRIGGVDFFLTHGHRHGVKTYMYMLIADARNHHAQAALFGHTHEPHCHQEEDGMWVLNPGSCGHYGATAGLVVIDSGRIVSCEIVRHSDLEVQA